MMLVYKTLFQNGVKNSTNSYHYVGCLIKGLCLLLVLTLTIDYYFHYRMLFLR